MPIYRAQVSFGADSALPRDRFVITPVLANTGGVLTDAEAQPLANDLRDRIVGWLTTYGTPNREVQVKLYNAETPGSRANPNFPLATAIANANLFPASGVPRELAVCLSFYSERNTPRRRGRLYVPLPLLVPSSIAGTRPNQTLREAVGALSGVLTGAGGVDIDWSVHSRLDGVARAVTHWWVDDEYDVQRRRGFRSTTRTTGTTSELTPP